MVRIVKLEFKPEFIISFREVYTAVNQKILAMPGCNGVQLLQDITNKNIFFTYSNWDNEAALNNYRNSALFLETWQTIKPWFANKAEAWSVE
jgi:quinol monooxygenase YgiN